LLAARPVAVRERRGVQEDFQDGRQLRSRRSLRPGLGVSLYGFDVQEARLRAETGGAAIHQAADAHWGQGEPDDGCQWWYAGGTQDLMCAIGLRITRRSRVSDACGILGPYVVSCRPSAFAESFSICNLFRQ